MLFEKKRLKGAHSSLRHTSKPFARKTANGTSEIGVQKNWLLTSDFFLLPNLKIWLGGKRFLFEEEEVIAAVDEYFEGFETSYFSEGMKNWKIIGRSV